MTMDGLFVYVLDILLNSLGSVFSYNSYNVNKVFEKESQKRRPHVSQFIKQAVYIFCSTVTNMISSIFSRFCRLPQIRTLMLSTKMVKPLKTLSGQHLKYLKEKFHQSISIISLMNMLNLFSYFYFLVLGRIQRRKSIWNLFLGHWNTDSNNSKIEKLEVVRY